MIQGKFADGKPHKLQYWRFGGAMYLTVRSIGQIVMLHNACCKLLTTSLQFYRYELYEIL